MLEDSFAAGLAAAHAHGLGRWLTRTHGGSPAIVTADGRLLGGNDYWLDDDHLWYQAAGGSPRPVARVAYDLAPVLAAVAADDGTPCSCDHPHDNY